MVKAPLLAAQALNNENIRDVEMRRKPCPLRRRQINIDIRMRDKLLGDFICELAQAFIEVLGIPQTYCRTLHKSFCDNLRGGSAGFTLQVAQPSQSGPVEDIEVRNDKRLAKQQRFESGQAVKRFEKRQWEAACEFCRPKLPNLVIELRDRRPTDQTSNRKLSIEVRHEFPVCQPIAIAAPTTSRNPSQRLQAL
jgi:hypothetical protein